MKEFKQNIALSCSSCCVPIVGRKTTKIYCRECLYKRQLERQRVYEKQRYEIERAGTARIGDIIQCAGCAAEIVRTAPLKRYCSPCRKTELVARSRAKYRERRGVRMPGSKVACACCGRSFSAKTVHAKYCKATNAPVLARARERRKVDAAFVIRNAVRSSLYSAIKGRKSGRKWQDILGYSVAELMKHLERQFARGMSWANYGQWHIDHILPIASFALESGDIDEVRAAWAMTNLRPLWRLDNSKKQARRTLLI